MVSSIRCPSCGKTWAGQSAEEARLQWRLDPCGCDAAPAEPSNVVVRSHEVRWFGDGYAPEELVDWYAGLFGLALEQPERTDRYLCLPGWEAVGIKVREGRFEVKSRDGEPRALSVPGVEGRASRWTKWSTGGGHVQPFLAGLGLDGGPWVSCTKTRWVRPYLVGDGGLAPNPDEAAEGARCHLEVAELAVGGRLAWTLCLECFDPSGRAPDASTLDTAARTLLAAPPPVGLSAESSMSFPRWLARLG